MKRIVILCDGTWNRSDSRTPTNVVRLAQAMQPVDPLGIVQVPIYLEGVGNGRGPTRLSRWVDRAAGGAFGWGLMRSVEDAYRNLVFAYTPGDEIFIFGFSRGAYTARSLTGLIRSTGIIDRHRLHLIPEAIARYRRMDDPATHPGSDESHAFRLRVSPQVTTSAREAAWRDAEGAPAAHPLRIRYLGVWDSVGALGVPRTIPLLSRWTARKYRFHDADLSSLVASARHAVAIDEHRAAFEPTHWHNIADLNDQADDPTARPYRELFFPGDHGSVGGGGDIRDLSSIALRWVIEGAQTAGLGFDAREVRRIAREGNPMGPLNNWLTPPRGVLDWMMRRKVFHRPGPRRMADVHESACLRYTAEAKGEGYTPYRPPTLDGVGAEIAAWHVAQQSGAAGDHSA